jgi:hypothetical protein
VTTAISIIAIVMSVASLAMSTVSYVSDEIKRRRIRKRLAKIAEEALK